MRLTPRAETDIVHLGSTPQVSIFSTKSVFPCLSHSVAQPAELKGVERAPGFSAHWRLTYAPAIDFLICGIATVSSLSFLMQIRALEMNKTFCSLIFWGCFRIRQLLNVKLLRRIRQAAFLSKESFKFKHPHVFSEWLILLFTL